MLVSANGVELCVPGARLLPLEEMGHEMPPRPLWDTVVAAILEHTAERPSE
jgi:hypothetical protein